MWRAKRHKERKAVLTQILVEEKELCEAINRLAALRSQDLVQQLRWARDEENGDFILLFGRLAELNWMWGEIIHHVADKQKAFGKVFKDIYQEERIVEETRKALVSCTARLNKLQKQLDGAKNSAKIQSLEVEVTTQNMLLEHLTASLESQTQKLELYKVDLVQKGLIAQAEGLLSTMTQCQALLQAQIELAELLSPDTEDRKEDIGQLMKSAVSSVASALKLHPPTNGGIDMRKLSSSPTHSPSNARRSVVEAPLEFFATKSKTFDNSTQSPVHSGSKVHRKSFPTSRPLPRAPVVSVQEAGLQGRGQGGEEEEEDSPERVQMRRVQSGGSVLSSRVEHDQRRRSTISLDQHSEATLLDDFSRPRAVTDIHDLQKQYTESETDSAPYSSTEDLYDSDPGYATIGKIRSALITDSSDPGYAIPIDALQEFFESQKRSSEDGGEGKDKAEESPYQTFEEIRLQRELQLQREREGEATPTVQTDDNPGYSRVFDAVLNAPEPLRVAPDVSRKMLNVSPLPWQRSHSPLTHDRSRRCGMVGGSHQMVWLKPLSNSEEESLDVKAPRPCERRQTCLGVNPSRASSSPNLLSVSPRLRSRSDANLLDNADRPRPPMPVPRLLERHPSGSAPSLLGSDKLANGTLHNDEEARLQRRAVFQRPEVCLNDLQKSKSFCNPLPVKVTQLRTGQAKVVPKRDAKKHSTA